MIEKIQLDGSTLMDITTREWHQCPTAVRNFIENVTYNPNDYSTSQILNYAPDPAVESNTKPIGNTVNGTTYYNEVPNVATPIVSGAVKPLDSLRWLNTTHPSGSQYIGVNARDLGGWKCYNSQGVEEGTVKYGMLIRGGEPNVVDKQMMVDKVGIKAELQLLPVNEQGADRKMHSVWGVDWYGNTEATAYVWYNLTNTALWKTYLKAAFDCTTHNKPLYFHCGAGADRTGTVAVMLEALLGMSQSDIDKDYELTNFSVVQEATSPRRRNATLYSNYISAIKAIPLVGGLTDSFRNRAVSFALSLGFTIDEINAYRTAMIDGTPETITISLDTYSVTKTLTNVATDSTVNSVNQFQGYEAEFMPSDGYVIDTVTVTMNGVDITQSCVTGDKKNNGIIQITTNGATRVDGYKVADVNVAPSVQSKTLTLGSTTPSAVTPDSGYSGLSSVSVSIDSSIINASNIANGVTILGIQGTHSGGITPSGSISIISNGTYDVTNYASASVNVSASTPTAKSWKFTVPSTLTSGSYLVTSGDSDVASHYADASAIACLSYQSTQTSYAATQFISMITANHALMHNGTATSITKNRYGLATFTADGSFGLGNGGLDLTSTSSSWHIGADSSGNIRIYVSNYALAAGSYILTFGW